MRDRDISVIADDLSCPSNSTDLEDCSASLASGECDADDALWLSCTNEESWELSNLTLAYNGPRNYTDQELETGNDYGTVLVTLRNTRSGEEKIGFIPYTYSSYTRSSMCYMIGNTNRYPSYRRTGQISATAGSKVSDAFIEENEIEFVLSYFWCPGRYQKLSTCYYKLASDDYNPGNDNAMWLNC
eukprot:sb/3471344/